MSHLDEAWIEHRQVLTSLAYEILGDWGRAEDVVSAAWERAHRELREVHNPVGWLRTVTTRLAIDEARSARARRESYVGAWLPEPVPTQVLPDEAVVNRSMLGLGFLRLIEQLDPLERAIFVLREGFSVPYAQISECVGRSPAACRQTVSRAKRLLPAVTYPEAGEDRRLLSALVAAVVDGDVSTAVELVSDGCVLWSDGGGVVRVAPQSIAGAEKIVRFLLGVQRKNPITRRQFVAVNGSTALLIEAADGIRLVTVERDAWSRATELQMHANPIKVERVRRAAAVNDPWK